MKKASLKSLIFMNFFRQAFSTNKIFKSKNIVSFLIWELSYKIGGSYERKI